MGSRGSFLTGLPDSEQETMGARCAWGDQRHPVAVLEGGFEGMNAAVYKGTLHFVLAKSKPEQEIQNGFSIPDGKGLVGMRKTKFRKALLEK